MDWKYCIKSLQIPAAVIIIKAPEQVIQFDWNCNPWNTNLQIVQDLYAWHDNPILTSPDDTPNGHCILYNSQW